MFPGNKRNHKEYTVFVANLPDDLDQYGLKGVFKKAGQVSDTYIPRSRSGRNAYRFGFVRFNSRNEAARSIFMLNNIVIRRKRIRVSMAKYERSDRRWKGQLCELHKTKPEEAEEGVEEESVARTKHSAH